MKHKPQDKECLNYMLDMGVISQEEYNKEVIQFEE